MSSVTALKMDTITDKSGHSIVPNAVSVCITPAAPSPLPLPYPVVANANEGVTDPPMRTKINGALIATVGSVLKTCHGNEPGTLKEVVSLNTSGPCFLLVGAPNVYCELGMMGITGSLCISNKSITVGAPANANGAGGAAGGGGGGGGGNGPNADANKGPDPSNNGGAGGDGTNTGAADAKKSTPDRYCPKPGTKAPKDMLQHIEDNDLRNGYNKEKANKRGRGMANAACFGLPGGKNSKKGQAFWSGGKAAVKTVREFDDKGEKFTIQEDGGGAKTLDQKGEKGKLPGWKDDTKAGKGSGITNEKLWKTISRRSAENADGTVDAFCAGTAPAGNVFSSVELPTLLHNDKVDKIRFRNPNHKPPPAPVEQEWNRNKKDGCWEGGPVAKGPKPKKGDQWPGVQGFQLDSEKGFTRFPEPPDPVPTD